MKVMVGNKEHREGMELLFRELKNQKSFMKMYKGRKIEQKIIHDLTMSKWSL